MYKHIWLKRELEGQFEINVQYLVGRGFLSITSNTKFNPYLENLSF